MISKKVGIVESIKSSDDNLEDIRVNVSGQIQRAYNYPKTFDPVSPIMPLAFKSILKYANTFGSIRSGNTFVYPVNVIYIGIIITK